ncbi:MAG TPA: LON peptidase substrate-binding domain-containing protein, partial [Blastocatellia bacterium]|nr:LON peptidase substrate-binding domain-containing protein [Blastocatellia bacterium]
MNPEKSLEASLEKLPVLPLKNTVVFPFTALPLAVGRASSVAAIEAALVTDAKELVIVTQRDRVV